MVGVRSLAHRFALMRFQSIRSQSQITYIAIIDSLYPISLLAQLLLRTWIVPLEQLRNDD